MPIITNAITLLKKDHRVVEGIFKTLKAVDKIGLDEREKLFNKLKQELNIHAHLEETIFYPALRSIDEEDVRHAYADHAEVKDILEELAGEDKSTEEWMAKLEGLEEDVEEHVKEEEEVILPKAEQALGEEKLQELGKQMQAERDSMKKDEE